MDKEKQNKYYEYIKNKVGDVCIEDLNFEFSYGLHNDVVIVRNAEVFRFAKQKETVEFFEKEINILNLVKDFVNIPVPNYEYIERGIGKCKFFSGIPLYRDEILSLREYEQDKLAEQIGIFLKQLHSIPLKKINENKIGDFPGNGTRYDHIKQFERIQEKLFPLMSGYTIECINKIFKPIIVNENFFDYSPVLIHGDLAPFHFIYNTKENKINAIIDFGVSGLGDPAHDVGVILDNFGEKFVKRMGSVYPDIPNFIDRSRYYARVSALWWSLRGVETNDISWNLFHHNTARDIMPYGVEL
ncbi:aminoglycoside phosphotransferase family protein [Clostridium sp. C2-6-12]|uniref:aminoglycoside phosphotransferase family protein n=1 Tax=Clostridium sp. C2-6-12 TaxID=2698832 RepID=UPI00136C5F1A|nr:aminoglycoside phosphotransferase family protein [Clostridium sp. C2-6-12]